MSGQATSRRSVSRELAVLVGLYLLYDAVRWLPAGEGARAHADAHWILSAERLAGVAIERSLQRALSFGAASWTLACVYLAAQLLVLPGALVWLYLRAPAIYRRLRDTVVAVWLLALPVFVLFPVAPPRLSEPGISDTVSTHAPLPLTGGSTLFYNPYAAVPSLHVALAWALGAALCAAARRRALRIAAALWGPLVTVAVIATGNHYLFDVAGGLAVAVAGFWLSGARSGGSRALAGGHDRGARAGRQHLAGEGSDVIGAVVTATVDEERRRARHAAGVG